MHNPIAHVLVLGIYLMVVKSQVPGPTNVKAPPSQSSCEAEDQAIIGPQSAGSCRSYPAKRIAVFLRHSKGDRRSVTAAIRSIPCFCNRKRIGATIKRGKRAIPVPNMPWIDTCPAKSQTYRLPRCISHFSQKCWVLRQWWNLQCPFKYCSQRKCGNVNPVSPKLPFIRVSQCRHTNRYTIRFYIWCPKSGRVFPRTVSLPQCCSCMTRVCRPIIT